MELVNKDKTEAASVVSVMEAQGGNTDEGLTINQSFLFADFSTNVFSLSGKYDVKFSKYWNRMYGVLDNLSSLDHQINLAKKRFRKRMRSAVDTSNELSEKIRKIEERAREEEDLDEEESDFEEEGAVEETEEEQNENCGNEESDENEIEEDPEDGTDDVDEEEGGEEEEGDE